jgi:ATP synthase F1 delta subunit
MPVIFRMRRRLDSLWEQENRLLPVHVTSAIALEDEAVAQIGERVGAQTGRRVELTATVDEDILGGIVLRVGNAILDASIRNRLEQLRKQVARG